MFLWNLARRSTSKVLRILSICQTPCRNEKRVPELVTYLKTIAKSQENPFLGFCCSLLFRIFLKLRPKSGRSLGGLLGR